MLHCLSCEGYTAACAVFRGRDTTVLQRVQLRNVGSVGNKLQALVINLFYDQLNLIVKVDGP